ncbi:MAG: transposase [Moheibacter sp.]
MEDKYQNKYRIASARAQWWDYGWNRAYFITICTKNREHFFGEIKNGKMILTPLGAIAHVLWHEIPHHAKYVELGDFVVMPNHIHGILIIDKPNSADEIPKTTNDVQTGAGGVRIESDSGQTGHALSLSKNPGQKRFQNIGKNTISSIVGSYKSAVTKYANRLELPHDWQDLFYDNIIRSDADYQRISNYIVNNPKNWKDDKLNSDK